MRLRQAMERNVEGKQAEIGDQHRFIEPPGYENGQEPKQQHRAGARCEVKPQDRGSNRSPVLGFADEFDGGP